MLGLQAFMAIPRLSVCVCVCVRGKIWGFNFKSSYLCNQHSYLLTHHPSPHLIFLDCSWQWVTKDLESRTPSMEELLFIEYYLVIFLLRVITSICTEDIGLQYLILVFRKMQITDVTVLLFPCPSTLENFSIQIFWALTGNKFKLQF